MSGDCLVNMTCIPAVDLDMSSQQIDHEDLNLSSISNQSDSKSKNFTEQEEKSSWYSRVISYLTNNKERVTETESIGDSGLSELIPAPEPLCLMNYTVHRHNMTVSGPCRQMYSWGVMAYDYLMNSTLRRLNVTETGVYKQLHYWSSVAYGWLSTGISVVYHQLTAWGSIVYEYLMNNAILRRLKVTEIAVVLNRWISVAYNWVLAWCITVYDRLYCYWYGDGGMSVRAPH